MTKSWGEVIVEGITSGVATGTLVALFMWWFPSVAGTFFAAVCR